MTARALRALTVCCAVAVPLCGGASAARAEHRIDYTVTVDPNAYPLIDLTATLTGFSGEPVYMNIPLGYAYTNVKSDHLEGLAAVDSEGREAKPFVVEKSIYGWEHAPAKVSYQIRLTHQAEIKEITRRAGLTPDAYEHPFLTQDRAFLVGAAVFLVPDLWDLPTSVTFHVPKGWNVLAPWPKDGDAYRPSSLRALTHNFVALGNWESHTVELPGCVATLALGASMPFDVEQLVEACRKVMEQEIRIFGRAPHPEYHLFFVDGGADTMTGSPKAGSMALSLGADTTAGDLPLVLRLIAHEFFHLFAHGRQPAADDLRVVNEGFTEYYAYVACSRAGVMPEKQLLRTLVRFRERIDGLPKGLTLRQAQTRFFTGKDGAALCYVGGFFRALELDAKIRADSNGERSLDDLVRHLYNGAMPALTVVPEPFTYEAWLATAAKWWPEAPEGLFDLRLDAPLPWDWDAIMQPTGVGIDMVRAGMEPPGGSDSVFRAIFRQTGG
jgi:predicted metalloprotease with PDZ domain